MGELIKPLQPVTFLDEGIGIDAHHHCWDFDADRDTWITDEMAVLKQHYTPADLAILLDQNGLQGSVFVQTESSEAGNRFMIELAANHSFIKGLVAWVDLFSEKVVERLEYYQQFPIVKGFRYILQDDPNRALMLDPVFKRGISALFMFGYTYDILIYADQLKYAKQLVSSFPNQKFVIDHIAKPGIKNKEIGEWSKDILALAKDENVYCKVSGMVTEASWNNWSKEDFKPYLDTVVEAFGPERLMFGSDWPVCLLAASYKEMLDIAKEYFSAFPKEEQNQVFGGNAIRFYNLVSI